MEEGFVNRCMAVMSLMSNEDFYERALTHSPEVAAAKAAQQVPTGLTRIGVGFDHETTRSSDLG